MEKLLKSGSAAMGIALDDGAITLFRKYWETLTDDNMAMNLTAITEESEVATKHFLDCLTLFQAADFRGKRIIDVGSGAGFPGIPIKLAEPEAEVVLLDSQKKRVEFLEKLCRVTQCEDVECIHGRAEETALLPAYREQFDYAVSRAVARLNLLSELCLPFVKTGGKFMAMKSRQCDEELEEAENAVKILGGEFLPPLEYTIPGTDLTRKIVIIQKISPTPKEYPRRFAKMQRKPL